MTFSSKMFRCKWQLILYAACSLYSSTLPFAVEANGSISGETSNDGFYLRHHGTVHEAGSSFHRVAPAKPREHFEDVTLSPRLPRRHHQNQHQTENIKQKDESPVNPAKVWAVLVAGSNGYFNYRHQADVCHAYQILIRNGVPRQQIITMMYDDIANNTQNPTPGVIINRPNGTNVYSGVEIDYRGEDVTPENFIKVLLGDEEGMKGVGSGKVLGSTRSHHVFINFVDHGAPGLVAFPSTELHAKELEKTLIKMHHRRKYGKLVFYLEACESGSMFQRILPSHMDIFATTAANGHESSYACYYDEQRETYLGDLYSVNWMENSDQSNLGQETIQAQFLIVKNETNTSHVMEFGDKSIRNLPVAQFLGYSADAPLLELPKFERDSVDSAEIVPTILQRRIAMSTDKQRKRELKSQLKKLYKMRQLISAQMTAIIEQVTVKDKSESRLDPQEKVDQQFADKDTDTHAVVVEEQEKLRHKILHSRHDLTNFDCYESAARHFSQSCFSIAKNPYVTRKLYILVNMCELGIESEKILNAMRNTCRHEWIVGIH